MAKFFIDRPIFAWVIAIIVMMAGALSILALPVAQYPAIAPPTVSINTTYPGASAKTLEDTVTQVIEQRMNGLDGLRYLASSSDSSGNASITLTFEAGTQGAMRFEVQGIVDGEPLLVVEHVTRIDAACAPDWPSPADGGAGGTTTDR